MAKKPPAAIRYKNPGAMWPGPTATKWGSKSWDYLNDGTGQGGIGPDGKPRGNKIARFDRWVDGIAAQIYLWRNSKNYKNKKLVDALSTWSGGNNVLSYVNGMCKKIPGLTPNTIMNANFWDGPYATQFLKAQSAHEAGERIPASDEEWAEGQRMVTADAKKADIKNVGGGAAVGGTLVVAHEAGAPVWLLITVAVIAVGAFVYFKFIRKHDVDKPEVVG